jgi:adenylate cyclase
MSGGGGRILVVDDVPENVRLLEAVLVPRGYDVVSTTAGSAALELAVSSKPDLILLDVVMPPPDGYEVCRRLRAREQTAMLPVIMLTASIGPEKTNAIEAGARTTSSQSPSTTTSCSRESDRCSGSSATTTRSSS